MNWLKELWKDITHQHKWTQIGETVFGTMNRNFGCKYSRFKCECGSFGIVKEYPDGRTFTHIIDK